MIPELDVSDLGSSLSFYALLGFELAYQRLDERFAYLTGGGAHLMLQEARGPGRRFRTAPLERPFGRGLNLQLEVEDVDAVHDRVVAAVERNPCLDRTEDLTQLHVVFLPGTEDASLGSINPAGYAPEEAAAVGRHVYLFLPSGMARSKLAADLARHAGSSGTVRNWRTVTKLVEMAGEAT